MTTFSLLFIVAACTIAQVIQATPFEQCAQGPPALELRVTNCNENPCKFTAGNLITVAFDFQAITATDTISLTVVGTANGTVLETVNINNACSLLSQGSCPLAKGEKATLEYEHIITKNYSSDFVVGGQYTVFDNNNNREVCVEYTGIVNP